MTHPILWFCLLAACEVSATLSLALTDQHNQPLENVIIEIEQFEKNTAFTGNDAQFVMDQINKEFKPHILTVTKNAMVSFPNSDDIRHHVYSFSKAKPFELKLYAGKPKSPIRFENLGVVVLGCNIHDSMVGYIYIHDNNVIYQSDSKGVINVDLPISSIKQMWAWHPRNSEGADTKRVIDITSLTENEQTNIQIDILPPETRNSFQDVFKQAQ